MYIHIIQCIYIIESKPKKKLCLCVFEPYTVEKQNFVVCLYIYIYDYVKIVSL